MVEDAERILRRAAGGAGGAVAALRHDAPHFRGLSSGDAERLRGGILAAMERRPEAGDALSQINEELRTSLSPVVIAGAARAVRGLAPGDDAVRALLQAASERIRIRDEYVSFGSARPRTAREEIELTLALMTAPPPPCCARESDEAARVADARPAVFVLDGPALDQVRAEDQSGARMGLAPRLRARRSVVSFFYTRCMNPSKCSLTITRLAALSRTAGDEDPNLLAISYDGLFDTPARLNAYGLERGFRFGERSRLLRCRSGWPALRRAFDLRVGYGEATVNEHAREVFVVDRGLRALAVDADLLAKPAELEEAFRRVAADD